MREHTDFKIEKHIAVLLAVMFLVSITAAVGCAAMDPTWTTKEQKDYNKAFNKAKLLGNTQGMKKGKVDGSKYCKEGMDNNGGDSSVGFRDPLSDSPKDVGTSDGWNIGYDEGYAKGFAKGYADCEDAGLYDTKTPGSVQTPIAYSIKTTDKTATDKTTDQSDTI